MDGDAVYEHKRVIRRGLAWWEFNAQEEVAKRQLIWSSEEAVKHKARAQNL